MLRMWFGIFTCTCTAHQGMVVGICHFQGRQPLPWGRSPVSFEQISQPSFFSWWLLTWFGTFTRTCTSPQGMVVGTCHLQGGAAPTMGQVPCDFQADQPWCSFSGEELRQRFLPALPCSGWCIIHGQWLRMWFCTFTCTCTAHQGMVAGTCCLQGRQHLPWGRSPVNFEQIGQPSFFSWWPLTWFGTFTCTCTAPRGMVVGTCHLQGRQPLPWGRSPVSFRQIGQPSFFSHRLLTWFGTFTLGSTASRGF